MRPSSFLLCSCLFYLFQVCLLTYPITILPPSTMIEQMILERWSKWRTTPGVTSSLLNRNQTTSGAYQPIVGTGGSVGANPGDKLTMELKDESPPLEASLPMRVVNRFLLMAFCTLLSTSVPCFGIVSQINE
jgi:hypothetical protein